ncbi:hypothetical protein N6H14_00230 [Paenibacillus sp. CC-CFT747]|nr:hypothetical protein N6H14_00230 [Paenibacillus sp. CC-CFT747]
MATLMFPDSILLAVKAPGTADDPARIAEGLLHRRFGTSIRFITICCDGTTTPDLEWRESPGGEDPYVLIGTRGRTSTITFDREQGIGHSIGTEQEEGNHE